MADVENIYPTTSNQAAYLVASRAGSSSAYQEQFVIPFDGKLDQKRFHQAWDEIVSSHEILRTAIAWQTSGLPAQIVLSNVRTQVPTYDWSDIVPEERRQRMHRLLREEREAPLPMDRPPMVRLVLVRINSDQHELIWTHHHGILDGWSQILLLNTLLDRLESERPPTLEPSLSFGAYAAWLKVQNTIPHRDFWREQLSGLATTQRSTVSPGEYGTHEAWIGSEELSVLRDRVSDLKVTMGTLFHGVWAWVISRNWSIDDLCIGSTVSGRPANFPNVEKIIGPFATTVPLRIKLAPSASLRSWLRELQTISSRAREHSYYPIGQILSWAELPPDTTLFDAVLAWANYPRTGTAGSLVNRLTTLGGRTRHALTLIVREVETGLHLRLVNERSQVEDPRARELIEGVVVALKRVATENVECLADLGDVCAHIPTIMQTCASQPLDTEDVGPGGVVRALFAEVLGRTYVDPTVSFLSLGGHSLLALELLSRLRRALDVDLTLADLLDAQNAIDLTERVTEKLELEPCNSGGIEIEDNTEHQHDPFPLSPLQAAYLIGRDQCFPLGGVDTRVYAEFEVQGVDLDRVAKAVNRLVERHPMLRAVFTGNCQTVLPSVPQLSIKLAILDPANPDASLEVLRQEAIKVRSDASKWPLFEIIAVRVDDVRTNLLLSADLLIGDAKSWQVLMKDFCSAYNHPSKPLPPPLVRYRDYRLARERERLSEIYERASSYWKERIAQLPVAPLLPTISLYLDSSTRFTRRKLLVNESGHRALRSLSNSIGVTPSVLLATVFSEVLARYAETPHFLLNLTLLDRPGHDQGLDDVVGDFTSLLLLEINAGLGTLRERARTTQRQLWTDLQHRAFDGVEVIDEMRRSGRSFEETMMPVVFTSTLGLGDYAGEWESPFPAKLIWSIGSTPQVTLDYQCYQRGDQLSLVWDTVDDAFPSGLLDDMFRMHSCTLERLLEGGVELAEIPVADLISNPFKNEHICQPRPDAKCALHIPFFSRAESDPNAIAVIASDRCLTYGELAAEALSLAAQLRSEQVSSGLVAVILDNGWRNIVAVLGVLAAGYAWVPLSPSWPETRIRTLLEQTSVQVVVSEQDVLGSWGEGRTVLLVSQICPNDVVTTSPVRTDPDALAYVIYTSGSTGEPKGVMVSHASVLNTILEVNERFSVKSSDRILAVSPCVFDLAIYDVFGPLSIGGALVIPALHEVHDPAVWLRLIERHQITLWNSVPVLMELLTDVAERCWHRLSTLRVVLLSGDWINTNLVLRLTSHTRAEVVSLGGATECSIWSIAFPIRCVQPEWTRIPYGTALRGQSVVIRDERMQPCPPWVPGEVVIGGAGVALGYLDNEQETDRRFLWTAEGDRLYRTGDLGRLLPDGNIEFLGRLDDQVKIRGYRVELREVEIAFARLPGVQQAAVVAAGPNGLKTLAGFLVGPTSTEPLIELLKSNLPLYMIPSTLRILDALPLTTNGKIDRRALSALVEHQKSADTFGELVYSRLTNLVSAQLGRPPQHIEEDLFAAGLTSVDMIRLFNSIEKEYDVRPPVSAFFERPTLGNLVDAVEGFEPSVTASQPSSIGPWTGPLQTLEEIARFKAEGRRGLGISLPHEPRALLPVDNDHVMWQQRRSVRRFEIAPVPHIAFAGLLGVLSQHSVNGEPRFLYPSAGGLYSVSAFVHVRPNRVEGLRAGMYIYRPDCADLLSIFQDIDLASSLHKGSSNQGVAESAAFTIFLAVDPADVSPAYGPQGRDLVLLESGYLGQLLCSLAIPMGLGLCPIGSIHFDRIRHLFPRGPRLELLHTLLGGIPVGTKPPKSTKMLIRKSL